MLLVAVIDPITSSAHLRINTRPERNEFSLPKVTLKVAFERIGIGLSRAQVDTSRLTCDVTCCYM